jgi:hypothetical protein
LQKLRAVQLEGVLAARQCLEEGPRTDELRDTRNAMTALIIQDPLELLHVADTVTITFDPPREVLNQGTHTVPFALEVLLNQPIEVEIQIDHHSLLTLHPSTAFLQLLTEFLSLALRREWQKSWYQLQGLRQTDEGIFFYHYYSTTLSFKDCADGRQITDSLVGEEKEPKQVLIEFDAELRLQGRPFTSAPMVL